MAVNIGPEALVAGWKVVCFLSGGPWLDDLRDRLDLYKGSQGIWDIGIPMVPVIDDMPLRPVTLLVPGRCLPDQDG